MSHIKLDEVCLDFKVQRKKAIKDYIIKGSERFQRFDEGGIVHALKNLTFELNDGDRLAVVGHNGAGKSTLLKTLAGIYPITSGRIESSGKISSLFEMATGFEMESSGFDNIKLRGLMLGETPKTMNAKVKEIAEFSELGELLNMPVKYYSSGMFIRLAFSVSTAIEPEILLLDEVIGAGDAGFISKAQKRMKELMASSRILVFVTHNMSAAMELCNRCIWMERGEIVMDGNVKEVTECYLRSQRPEG